MACSAFNIKNIYLVETMMRMKKGEMTLEQVITWALIIIAALVIMGVIGYLIFKVAIGRGLPAIFG